jgi:uncharacterized protein YkwD
MYKRNKLFSFLVLFLNLVYSIQVQASTNTSNHDDSIPNVILHDVNSYRQNHHLAPLKMDARISRQAQIHSQNMAQHRLPFGHTHFLKRIKILRKEIKNAGAAAENVAFNYKDGHVVVQNWLLSPGHKQNIQGNYDLTGVGIARDTHGKIYFTQIFIKTQATSTRHSARRHYAFFAKIFN